MGTDAYGTETGYYTTGTYADYDQGEWISAEGYTVKIYSNNSACYTPVESKSAKLKRLIDTLDDED